MGAVNSQEKSFPRLLVEVDGAVVSTRVVDFLSSSSPRSFFLLVDFRIAPPLSSILVEPSPPSLLLHLPWRQSLLFMQSSIQQAVIKRPLRWSMIVTSSLLLLRLRTSSPNFFVMKTPKHKENIKLQVNIIIIIIIINNSNQTIQICKNNNLPKTIRAGASPTSNQSVVEATGVSVLRWCWSEVPSSLLLLSSIVKTPALATFPTSNSSVSASGITPNSPPIPLARLASIIPAMASWRLLSSTSFFLLRSSSAFSATCCWRCFSLTAVSWSSSLPSGQSYWKKKETNVGEDHFQIQNLPRHHRPWWPVWRTPLQCCRCRSLASRSEAGAAWCLCPGFFSDCLKEGAWKRYWKRERAWERLFCHYHPWKLEVTLLTKNVQRSMSIVTSSVQGMNLTLNDGGEC